MRMRASAAVASLAWLMVSMAGAIAEADAAAAEEKARAKERAAGTVSVAGRVTDAVGGQPLRGARVEIVNTALATIADADGRFVFAGLPARDLSVRAMADGYRMMVAPVASDEASRWIELSLTPQVTRFTDGVVVAAQRAEARPAEVPRSVSVLTAASIDRAFARTTPEALMDLPGVLVQKTNHGGGSPYLRGLVGNQVLVLVDGIRLNNSTFRYGPNQYLATVDVGQIERIEVVRGAGSVLYGSDAMGGVINIITRRPALSSGGLTLGGAVSSKFTNGGMERSGRVDLTASGARAALLGGVALRDYGDLRAGGDLGVEAPSAYSEVNGDVKALVRLTPRHLFTVAGQQVHQDDVPRFDQVAQRGFSRYSFDPQVRRLAYAQWQAFPARGPVQAVTSTASFHQSVEQRDRQQRGSPTRIIEQDDVRTQGASIEMRAAPIGRWAIVSGVELTRDAIGSWRRDTHEGTGETIARRGLYPDGARAWSAAAFASGTWQLPRTTIEAGLRFNQYAVRSDDAVFGSLEISPRAWVGSFALLQDVGRGVSLFGSISQAFRAPNVDDLSTLGAFDFGIEIPTMSLEPERSVAVETGVRLRRDSVAGSLTVYRTSLNDLIERVRGTFNGSDMLEGQRVYQRANVGRAYVTGVESEGEWRPAGGVTLFGHAAYTYGQQTTADQPMRRIPPFNGLVGARVALARRAWIEGTTRFATKQTRLASGDRDDHRIPAGGTPGWVVSSISAGLPIAAHLDLVGGLHNLFDEAYRIHGSGIDGYGRTAWAGAHVRF